MPNLCYLVSPVRFSAERHAELNLKPGGVCVIGEEDRIFPIYDRKYVWECLYCGRLNSKEKTIVKGDTAEKVLLLCCEGCGGPRHEE